jgi:hypothetical protein
VNVDMTENIKTFTGAMQGLAGVRPQCPPGSP